MEIEGYLKEKRRLDQENDELELKINGRSKTDGDAKSKLLDAERRLELRLIDTKEFHQEEQNKLSTLLEKEEEKAKKELDDKITAEQKMEDETEKANEEADKRLKNREDLIKLRLRSSLLKSANEKVTKELEEVKK